MARSGGVLATVCFFCLGCTGGLHRAGERQFTLLGSYGYPVKGEAIWPDGDGRAENAGLSLGYNYFPADRLALGASITPYRLYNQSDGDAYAGELQLAVRYYFAEFELGSTPASLFAEALGGMMHSARSVPEAGSHTNFTQDTGVGVELQLIEGVSWITGYRFRHLSNGYVFGHDNPSQNDHQVYTAIGFSW